MKTLEFVIQNYKSDVLDGRDITRLGQFLSEEQLPIFGLELKEGIRWQPKEFTRENILEQLKEDVAFGFEKALNKRGISSSLMYQVVSMWNWILEEGLENFTEYAQYGLPLFKATALKYGFPNPIGDDQGNEIQYASD